MLTTGFEGQTTMREAALIASMTPGPGLAVGAPANETASTATLWCSRTK